MEKTHDPYHISLFRPTTPQARYNRNMVLTLVSIWFVAVFGFQILLRVIQKPVPETPLIEFLAASDALSGTNPGNEELAVMTKAGLSVFGKNTLSPAEEAVIRDGITWSFLNRVPATERPEVEDQIRQFLQQAASVNDIADPEYLRQKEALSRTCSRYLSFDPRDIRQRLLPLAFSDRISAGSSFETGGEFAAILEKFMVHNQSFLTDMKFLGFPFHYFYTAVFLLILFVGLCWIYCVRTDTMNKKLQISE